MPSFTPSSVSHAALTAAAMAGIFAGGMKLAVSSVRARVCHTAVVKSAPSK
jgi:hypothetical protein